MAKGRKPNPKKTLEEMVSKISMMCDKGYVSQELISKLEKIKTDIYQVSTELN